MMTSFDTYVRDMYEFAYAYVRKMRVAKAEAIKQSTSRLTIAIGLAGC